jgi:uncharacterized membrane protein YphA (DoxX/SURF4 family)
MNAGIKPTGRNASELRVVLVRWALGALFLYMGLSKAVQPVEFLKLVREYELVQTPFWLNTIAATLPWFEVICGLLLLTGVAVRGTALLLLAMLVPFTLVVLQRALSMQAELAIPLCAVRFDCGCGAGEVLICRKLVENGLLILLSGGLLFSRSQRLCARHSLMNSEHC